MREDGARKREGLVRLKDEDPVYAARAIFPHLAGRRVVLGARKTSAFVGSSPTCRATSGSAP